MGSLDSPLLRRLRRALGGAARQAPDWARRDAMAERAMLLVRVFYALTLARFYGRAGWLEATIGRWPPPDPLWPNLWLDHVPAGPAADLLVLGLFAVGLGAVMAPHVRLLRIAVALGALQVAALENAQGAINHGLHEWVWIAVVLCFLPDGKPTPATARANREQIILVVATVTAMLLMFYTMSGAYKLGHATARLVQGEFGGFSPGAMAETVANRVLETRSEPPLAPLVIAWPLLGWPLFLGLYYIEAVALAIAFRPRLIPVWGALLVLFHLGTHAFMDIAFPDHVVWNVLFMLLVPHALSHSCWRSRVADLPLVGRAVGAVAPGVREAAARARRARPQAPP